MKGSPPSQASFSPYTAISRKVVGKNFARDNPERYCRVVLSSLFFKEIWKIGTSGNGRMFATAKVGLTATVSGTVYWSYPILPFGIVACSFFSDNLSRNSCKHFGSTSLNSVKANDPSMREGCCRVGLEGYLFSHIKSRSSWLGGWSVFPGRFFSV